MCRQYSKADMMDLVSTTRAAENRTGYLVDRIVAKSFVVPPRPCKDMGKNKLLFWKRKQ